MISSKFFSLMELFESYETTAESVKVVVEGCWCAGFGRWTGWEAGSHLVVCRQVAENRAVDVVNDGICVCSNSKSQRLQFVLSVLNKASARDIQLNVGLLAVSVFDEDICICFFVNVGCDFSVHGFKVIFEGVYDLLQLTVCYMHEGVGWHDSNRVGRVWYVK